MPFRGITGGRILSGPSVVRADWADWIGGGVCSYSCSLEVPQSPPQEGYEVHISNHFSISKFPHLSTELARSHSQGLKEEKDLAASVGSFLSRCFLVTASSLSASISAPQFTLLQRMIWIWGGGAEVRKSSSGVFPR